LMWDKFSVKQQYCETERDINFHTTFSQSQHNSQCVTGHNFSENRAVNFTYEISAVSL